MSTDAFHLPDDVEQLKAIIAAREVIHRASIDEREQIIRQSAELAALHAQKIAQHEVVISSQHDTIEKQQRKLERLEQQLAQLLRRQYGPQKERIDPAQLTLFTVEELEQLASELQQGLADSVSTDNGSPADAVAPELADVASPSQPKSQRKGHGRRPIPESIPRESVIHELTETERVCPCCGRLRKEIDSEISEQLEYIPAQLKVIQHHRIKYACEACEANVVVAPKPPQPIEKGLPGPGLLAFVTLSKYGDYLPLYRMEDILSRSGIILRRSTLCGWIASVSDLLKPLYDVMCSRVLRSRVIHTDDTSIKMLEPDQCRNCRFWTYAGDDANPFVVYEFSLTRQGENPTRFLEGFKGYLQADAFSGYDELLSTGTIIEVACMAHCRRYWWEAIGNDSRRAHEAISYIARLYELEIQFQKSQLTGDALRDARQQHAIPILNAFEAWMNQEHANVLPKSTIGQAFTYTRNQWQALCRYTEDGALDIDNNTAERMVKLPAIGRKNWLFVGSQPGGDRAAILLSIIASAKLCEVEPWAWLNAVLKELPVRLANTHPDQPPDLSDLLPDAWLKAHPEHRWKIDDIRKVEREQSRQQKSNKRTTEGR